MPRSAFSLFVSAAALVCATPALAAPEVAVSIKPLHSLVAGVMEGVGEPGLIVSGAASEHGYALRPSDAARIEAADIVFWIGPELETYLEGPLGTLAAGATIAAMMEIDGLALLDLREGGLFEAHSHDDHGHEDHGHDHHEDEHDDHDHGHEHHDHAHDDHDHHAHDDDEHDHHDHDHDHDDHGHAHNPDHADAHIWLDPRNARLMVAAIADTLIDADPENAETYNANGLALSQRLLDLEAQIEAQVAPVRGNPFFVFHDAYHYFEARFGIEATGSFTVNPEIAPGAARLSEIRAVVEDAEAVCLFAEPQFSPAVIETVAQGTDARIGVLDPLGADVADGPELYFTVMETIAGSLAGCLE